MNKEAKAAYHRKWSKRNPLKLAEISFRYWSKRLEELRKEGGVPDVKG